MARRTGKRTKTRTRAAARKPASASRIVKSTRRPARVSAGPERRRAEQARVQSESNFQALARNRVSFDKIARELPAFACAWDLPKGLAQLRSLFERVQLTDDRFKFRGFSRLDQLKHLVDTGQLDRDFFWTTP